MDNFEIIRIPMRANSDIFETEIFEATESGQIFYYDPDIIFHKELYYGGFLEEIPNNECEFTCNEFELIFGDKKYLFNETVDVKNFPDQQINNLVISGMLKKVVKQGPENKLNKKIENKKKNKNKIKKSSYSDISKKLELKPKEFKQKYFEKFNKEIEDMKIKVSKPTEKKIIEALSL